MKDNLLATWKQHVVIVEVILEFNASFLTLTSVLKADAHTENFRYILVRFVETGDCYRANHLLGDTHNLNHQ